MLVQLLSAPIRFYHRFISPMLGAHCRFHPTCSAYALEALRVHGAAKGLVLIAWRLLRCNPLCKWGYDPVPPKGKWVHPNRNLSR